MGQRRRAREIAVQGLYMYDVRLSGGEDKETLLADILSLGWASVEAEDEDEDKPAVPLNDDAKEFAAELIRETVRQQETIDKVISSRLKHWKPERLHILDKAILRMSVYSMLYMRDIPPAVSINEGIEIAKKFSGENSADFVNGILDAVNKTEIKSDNVTNRRSSKNEAQSTKQK